MPQSKESDFISITVLDSDGDPVSLTCDPRRVTISMANQGVAYFDTPEELDAFADKVSDLANLLRQREAKRAG